MAAELNMFQAQAGEYKYEIQRLTQELCETKGQYYESKRRESLSREVRTRRNIRLKKELNMSLPDISMATLPAYPRTTKHARQHSHRLTGGGFPITLN